MEKAKTLGLERIERKRFQLIRLVISAISNYPRSERLFNTSVE